MYVIRTHSGTIFLRAAGITAKTDNGDEQQVGFPKADIDGFIDTLMDGKPMAIVTKDTYLVLVPNVNRGTVYLHAEIGSISISDNVDFILKASLGVGVDLIYESPANKKATRVRYAPQPPAYYSVTIGP